MHRTKIVCTIGPASEKSKTLEALIRAGMNVARLNMSHGSLPSHRTIIKTIRAISKKLGVPVGILADLQGPKIRIGKLAKDINLENGSTVIFSTDLSSTGTARIHGTIPVDYPALSREIKPGALLLIDDGRIECRIKSVRGANIIADVTTGGMISSHKGINVPGAMIKTPSLTAKDLHDLKFALDQGVDFIALSFVRSARDVQDLRSHMKKSRARIIAKIEKQEAIRHFDEILNAADGVMVARGDLGLETEASNVPVVQKEIIAQCRRAAKPVIVATQMLDSMERNPRPTRAEVSDVANAVVDHTDAVMLSGETATGKYPVRAVEVMRTIIQKTEHSRFDDIALAGELGSLHDSVATSAALAALGAQLTGARALLIKSKTGYLGRLIARFRPELPTILSTHDPVVARQATLSWGMIPLLGNATVATIQKLLKLKKGNMVVSVASHGTVSSHESSIEIKTL